MKTMIALILLILFSTTSFALTPDSLKFGADPYELLKGQYKGWILIYEHVSSDGRIRCLGQKVTLLGQENVWFLLHFIDEKLVACCYKKTIDNVFERDSFLKWTNKVKARLIAKYKGRFKTKKFEIVFEIENKDNTSEFTEQTTLTVYYHSVEYYELLQEWLKCQKILKKDIEAQEDYKL